MLYCNDEWPNSDDKGTLDSPHGLNSLLKLNSVLSGGNRLDCVQSLLASRPTKSGSLLALMDSLGSRGSRKSSGSMIPDADADIVSKLVRDSEFCVSLELCSICKQPSGLPNHLLDSAQPPRRFYTATISQPWPKLHAQTQYKLIRPVGDSMSVAKGVILCNYVVSSYIEKGN